MPTDTDIVVRERCQIYIVNFDEARACKTAQDEAQRLGVPFLGGVPLHMDIRTKSDAGTPVVADDPDGPHAEIYNEIAAQVADALRVRKTDGPAIVFE